MQFLKVIDAGTYDTVWLNPLRIEKIAPEWLDISDIVPEAWKHEMYQSHSGKDGIPHHFARKTVKSRGGFPAYEMCLVSRVLFAGDAAKKVLVVLESPATLVDRLRLSLDGKFDGSDEQCPIICDGGWVDKPPE